MFKAIVNLQLAIRKKQGKPHGHLTRAMLMGEGWP